MFQITRAARGLVPVAVMGSQSPGMKSLLGCVVSQRMMFVRGRDNRIEVKSTVEGEAYRHTSTEYYVEAAPAAAIARIPLGYQAFASVAASQVQPCWSLCCTSEISCYSSTKYMRHADEKDL